MIIAVYQLLSTCTVNTTLHNSRTA